MIEIVIFINLVSLCNFLQIITICSAKATPKRKEGIKTKDQLSTTFSTDSNAEPTRKPALTISKTRASSKENVEKKPENLPEIQKKSQKFKKKKSNDKEKEKSTSLETITKDIQKSKRFAEQSRNTDKIDQRKTWAAEISKKKCAQLAKLHKERVKGFVAPRTSYKAFESNQSLNRFSDVFCIDSTRVILKKQQNDYIHASWIHIPDSQTSYILTQGPLTDTISDFWTMCLQEKIKYIVMLCPLMEDEEQCAQYFPDEIGQKEKYGNFEVTFQKRCEEPVENVGHSILSVADGEKPAVEINHIWVTWWIDHLAPNNPKDIIKLINWVKSHNPPKTPILVHCNSGAGRAATFAAIDYASIRLKQESDIDMVIIIRELRNMRYQAVQSHLQFLFIHVCLLELFIQKGIIERDSAVELFMEEYRKHADNKLAKRKAGDMGSKNEKQLLHH